jgi:hypothetical protein
MFNLAVNKCRWIMTRKPGKITCDKPCMNEFCSPHNMMLKAGSSPGKICTQCNQNGTRSITGLCLACGGQKAIKRIAAINCYYRKKYKRERPAPNDVEV